MYSVNLTENNLRSGSAYRNRSNTVVCLKYQQQPMRIRLTDIPFLQQFGTVHLDNILAARQGDQTAIDKLRALKYEKTQGLSGEFSREGFQFISLNDPDKYPFKIDLIHFKWPDFIESAPHPKGASLFDLYVDSYDRSFSASRLFIESVSKFIHVNYVAIFWQFLGRIPGENGIPWFPNDEEGAERRMIELFKKQGIRSILDIGCGPNLPFLSLIHPLCQKAGIKLYGINLGDFEKDKILPGVELVKGDAGNLSRYFPGVSFDLIVASGVLGQIQFMHDFSQRTRLSIRQAEENGIDIVREAIGKLSTNPHSAFYVQSFSSFLLLDKDKLSEAMIRVLYWNNEEMKGRKETSNSHAKILGDCAPRDINYRDEAYEMANDLADEWDIPERKRKHVWYPNAEAEQRRYGDLWRQGANVAVLAR